jgi:hypothetical protein
MNIKEFRKWINSLPVEFDEYQLTHREYYDGDGDNLYANEVGIVSVHIDDNDKTACLMHEQSYLIFKGDESVTKITVPSTKVEVDGL